ncbi:MAG: quinon protein alcohol dehydrogenase-like superfamily, partial [Linnemannia gamsii]
THQCTPGLSSPNGENIALASADNTVRPWNVKSGSLDIIGRHSKQVITVPFSPTGLHIAFGCSDGVVELNVGPSVHEPGPIFKHHIEEVRSLAYSLDGRQVTSGSQDLTIYNGVYYLRYLPSAEREQVLQGNSSSVNCVAFSPNGNQLASGSADKSIVLWNIELGERVPVIRDLVDAALSIAFSPDGQRIV